ncbi:unnamed protein product [Caenorhabditis auriculariae]|uniref:Uncharacterized protein n=1 Tax=Caenorhabditis auriculariae TaxID=2777116 RepID=A0A8S1HA92_9PELO|nr:unnamed protein product [Caenorhabditis auriculariae]
MENRNSKAANRVLSGTQVHTTGIFAVLSVSPVDGDDDFDVGGGDDSEDTATLSLNLGVHLFFFLLLLFDGLSFLEGRIGETTTSGLLSTSFSTSPGKRDGRHKQSTSEGVDKLKQENGSAEIIVGYDSRRSGRQVLLACQQRRRAIVRNQETAADDVGVGMKEGIGEVEGTNDASEAAAATKQPKAKLRGESVGVVTWKPRRRRRTKEKEEWRLIKRRSAGRVGAAVKMRRVGADKNREESKEEVCRQDYVIEKRNRDVIRRGTYTKGRAEDVRRRMESTPRSLERLRRPNIFMTAYVLAVKRIEKEARNAIPVAK